jgi:hypothetical protein
MTVNINIETSIIKLIEKLPNKAVYIIVNHEKKYVYVAKVKNGAAWLCRVIDELRIGMFKYPVMLEDEFQCIESFESNVMLNAGFSRIVNEYRNAGYVVYGGKKAATYDIKYSYKRGSCICLIVNARKVIVAKKSFRDIETAKAWVSGKTFEEMLKECVDIGSSDMIE